jgi:predicted AlkP superfamily phosphohydrolase/phosphomutase
MIQRSADDSPASDRAAGVQRDTPAIAKRVLIVGLDGATFDVLNPMMDAGLMPNLKAFIDRGASGVLESTKPPITPAAWTTFMTGKTPGTHGIVDFERYDVHTNRLSFNSTQSVNHVRNIWQIAGDKGLKVGAVNVPMTYPPRPVNGFLITGFETPGVDVNFTHPADLKDDLLQRWPRYTFKTNWKRKTFGGDALFAENVTAMANSFHEGAAVTRYCGDKYGWDLLMVVFKLVDNLQHKTWKYLDPKFNAKHPKRAAIAANCFAELDIALGELFKYAEEREAAVFIMSDHGHGSLEGKTQPNLLLKDWGYLKLRDGSARSTTRLRYLLDRARRKKKGKFHNHHQIDHDLAVDFSRTRACVMHAGMYGFLYLNLKGRQPDGIVEPSDYETLRDELRDRFLSETARNPSGETFNLFPEVLKPEELYGCSREDQPWMPDLLLAPADGLSVVRKIRGSDPVKWLPWRKIEGTHRLDGVFAVAGSGVASGKRLRANIIDSTPTILAMLGLRVPDDMEGNVLTELFDPPLKFETEAAADVSVNAADEVAYTEEEERVLTERLADLGYLE